MGKTLSVRQFGEITSTLQLTIPGTVEDIDALAADLFALTTGGQWATAALVSSRTRTTGGRPRKADNIAGFLTYQGYADRGLRGLSDWRTVKHYAEAWEVFAGRPKPELGEVVDLPDEPFPLRVPGLDEPLLDEDVPRHRPTVDGFLPGDFREIAEEHLPDDSVDLIFTDPPYDRKSLPLYEDLAEVGSRVLRPGGSLVCYLGQYQLPEVLELIRPHLRFWWPIALVHEGGTMARLDQLGVIVRWKPLLWFVKGTRADVPGYIEDLILSPEPEKGHHQWQQASTEAAYIIDHLSPEDGFVFDPFCGAGTTAIAAGAAGRDFLTCDIDAETLDVAKARFLG